MCAYLHFKTDSSEQYINITNMNVYGIYRNIEIHIIILDAYNNITCVCQVNNAFTIHYTLICY